MLGSLVEQKKKGEGWVKNGQTCRCCFLFVVWCQAQSTARCWVRSPMEKPLVEQVGILIAASILRTYTNQWIKKHPKHCFYLADTQTAHKKPDFCPKCSHNAEVEPVGSETQGVRPAVAVAWPPALQDGRCLLGFILICVFPSGRHLRGCHGEYLWAHSLCSNESRAVVSTGKLPEPKLPSRVRLWFLFCQRGYASASP